MRKVEEFLHRSDSYKTLRVIIAKDKDDQLDDRILAPFYIRKSYL